MDIYLYAKKRYLPFKVGLSNWVMINYFTCTCSAFSTDFYGKETRDGKGSHMVKVKLQFHTYEYISSGNLLLLVGV
jgi:hypothetical protein